MRRQVTSDPFPVELGAERAGGVMTAKALVPRFTARMSLVEARATILAAMRSLGSGGFTARVGMIAREACGARFGKYKPSEILNWLRSGDFQLRFEETLQNWKKGWESTSAKAARVRERQYEAFMSSVVDKWWERIADAIESMLARQAPQVVMEDSAGNRRVQCLADVMDLFFGIPMTGARSEKLRVVGTSD